MRIAPPLRRKCPIVGEAPYVSLLLKCRPQQHSQYMALPELPFS